MIVIVAERDDAGGAYKIADAVRQRFDSFDTRVSVLGHMQRGGSPTCFDRGARQPVGSSRGRRAGAEADATSWSV